LCPGQSPPASEPVVVSDLWKDPASSSPSALVQHYFTLMVGFWTRRVPDKTKTKGSTVRAVPLSALVLGRTRSQCSSRWHDILDPSINGANGRTGTWSEDEDSKLKDAVQRHGGKAWVTISALVPGRREVSVGTDGIVPWFPASAERVDVQVYGQQSKTAS
jgi:hypothetical protein